MTEIKDEVFDEVVFEKTSNISKTDDNSEVDTTQETSEVKPFRYVLLDKDQKYIYTEESTSTNGPVISTFSVNKSIDITEYSSKCKDEKHCCICAKCLMIPIYHDKSGIISNIEACYIQRVTIDKHDVCMTWPLHPKLNIREIKFDEKKECLWNPEVLGCFADLSFDLQMEIGLRSATKCNQIDILNLMAKDIPDFNPDPHIMIYCQNIETLEWWIPHMKKARETTDEKQKKRLELYIKMLFCWGIVEEFKDMKMMEALDKSELLTKDMVKYAEKHARNQKIKEFFQWLPISSFF